MLRTSLSSQCEVSTERLHHDQTEDFLFSKLQKVKLGKNRTTKTKQKRQLSRLSTYSIRPHVKKTVLSINAIRSSAVNTSESQQIT